MVGHVKKPKTEKVEKNVIVDTEAGLDRVPEIVNPSFDSVALSIVKRVGGGFNIIKVEIDSVNLTAGKVTIVAVAEGRAESVEKFKINVVKAGIV